MLLIEDRIPDRTAISGLPDAAFGQPEIKGRGVSTHPADGMDVAPAIRAHQPPTHAGIEAGRQMVTKNNPGLLATGVELRIRCWDMGNNSDEDRSDEFSRT